MGVSELVVVAGSLAGGFVSGLLGFGTGLTALAAWLTVLDPVVAAPLTVVCSIVAQGQTLPAIWHAIVWPRVLPFILGGVLGVPVGTLLLPHVSVAGFKLFIAVLLTVYCSFMLLQRSAPTIRWGGRAANGVVGLAGGIMGGLAGLSGVPPTIWASLRGWSKDQKRGVFQAFNLTTLSLAAISQAIGGFMTLEVGYVCLIALPGTVLGAWLGRRIYDQLGDGRFGQIVLVLLLFSGLSLIVTSLSELY